MNSGGRGLGSGYSNERRTYDPTGERLTEF